MVVALKVYQGTVDFSTGLEAVSHLWALQGQVCFEREMEIQWQKY